MVFLAPKSWVRNYSGHNSMITVMLQFDHCTFNYMFRLSMRPKSYAKAKHKTQKQATEDPAAECHVNGVSLVGWAD